VEATTALGLWHPATGDRYREFLEGLIEGL